MDRFLLQFRDMTETDPTTADKVNQIAETVYAIPAGLNRQERRVLERTLKQQGERRIAKVASIRDLTPLDPLLEEDDLVIYQNELRDHGFAREGIRITLERCGIYRAVGIPDSSVRTYYANLARGKVIQGGETSLWLQADPRKCQQAREKILLYDTHRKDYLRRAENRVFVDEDAEDMKNLMQDESIPLQDILKETIRSQSEKIELIKLQIEWLEAQQGVDDLTSTQPIEQPTQTKEQSTVTSEIQAPALQYALSGWNLYWTRNYWSSDTNHLIPIPTTSREDTLESLTDVARGEISIKPGSVLRALEFHLQKDILQRALAARNKYGPEGVKDWVKIKRGRDRIFFLMPQADQHQAIFFAAGRDVVYRGI